MNNLKLIENKIKNSKYTAIVCHQNPDGDTLGSAFALQESLRQMGLNSDVLCSDNLPNKYIFFDRIQILSEFDKDKYDLIVFLDCAELKLTGTLFDTINIEDFDTLSIDHHSTNSQYANINHVDSTYSSTAELVLDLLKLLKTKITKEIAEYLYVGMATDTGQFAYSYTSARTHKNAAFLLKRGVDFSKLHNLLFNSIPFSKLLLTKQMLKNANFIRENKIAIAQLSLEDFAASSSSAQDSESLVNTLLSVDTVKVAVLIRQISETIFKASFRSTDDIDISKAAKLLNGGGHKQAAGATVECAPDSVVKTVLKAIEDANLSL